MATQLELIKWICLLLLLFCCRSASGIESKKTVNHRRRILSTTDGHPARICKVDLLVVVALLLSFRIGYRHIVGRLLNCPSKTIYHRHEALMKSGSSDRFSFIRKERFRLFRKNILPPHASGRERGISDRNSFIHKERSK
jgi:hypothetical protein